MINFNQKFILFHKGITETLAYFSDCIANELEALGYPVLRFAIEDETQQLPELLRFLKEGNATLITFNFHGIQQEAIFYDKRKRLLWDVYNVCCINIVVDHPLYYWKRYVSLPERYIQLCIDGDHEDYMKKYYPEIRLFPFLPLAGNAPEHLLLEVKENTEKNTGENTGSIPNAWENCILQRERPYEIVFAGNYTPPQEFEPLLCRNGAEYEQFYRNILHDFFAHPDKSLNEVFEWHIRKNMGNLSEAEMTQAFHYLMFLDMYVRFYYRGEAVRRLTEAGISVHIFGSGFEKLKTSCPERLILHGGTDSQGCVEAFSKAKLSLNVMPWFKKGAHDRIYSSMLCGATVLTDTSEYLEQHFADKGLLNFYRLEQLEKLPELARELLTDEKRRSFQAEKGLQYAKEHLTWKQFTRKLLCYIENGSTTPPNE